VHLIRTSLKYVPRREYEAVVKDLRPIYTAINAQEAERALETTSPSTTPSPNGPEPAAGRKRCWHSKSSSETAYPTNRLHS
jgi:hypothetical protein